MGIDVILRGQVEEGELERWYRHAAVFLFPSRTEGFGFPPLEAMLRGVPVVAAHAASLPEVLGDAALFHDVDDAETVRSHISALMSDASLRERQIIRGRQRAALYRWEKTGAGVAAVLYRVLGAAPAPGH
jgi:glycosyltransferase involved in cell wall biosynthesis